MKLKELDILLVDDNPADVDLTLDVFRLASIRGNLHAVNDGVQALAYLRREGRFADAKRPDLILLDLNMPRMDGRELLARIKTDPELRSIPVLVLTTSSADADVKKSYDLHANCFVTKPVDLDAFIDVARSIEGFWLQLAELPPR